MERPLLVWDGNCGYCRRAVERLRYLVGDRLGDAPYQEVGAQFPGIPPARFAEAAHLIHPDGRVEAGARAIYGAHALRPQRRARVPAWLYDRSAAFRAVSDAGYRWVAGHRVLVDRVTRALVGRDLRPRQHRLTRWLYLRALGLTALCAFLSAWVQLDALVGDGGILPVAEVAPVGWTPSDAGLTALAAAGTAMSLLLLLDVAPVLMCLGAWAAYLALVHAGSVFFQYQWDLLLVEALFLSAWVAPWRLAPRLPASDAEPALPAVWLLRLLYFKLMFLSGVAKTGPTWQDHTSLQFHYFTQPIPAWTSWYAHHLPTWVHEWSSRATLFIETWTPLLIFGPRRLRQVAFAAGAFLMGAIAATGNYGFFNLLTLTIALMLLDDPVRDRPAPRGPRVWRAVASTVAVLFILVTLARVAWRVSSDPLPRPATWALERSMPLGVGFPYGLFARMTTERPEIEIEGSRDGVTWLAYDFRYKPGPLDERPVFTGVHMPRLDWQLWFAALDSCEHAPWFHALLQRILDGAPAVMAKLEVDPFGDAPPRYLRTTLWLYEPTKSHADGRWWRRVRVGEYCPVVERR